MKSILTYNERVYNENEKLGTEKKKKFLPNFKKAIDAFEKVFPQITSILKDMKKEGGESFKSVGKLLQGIERILLLDYVANNLRKEGIFCATIHDAFFVLEEDMEYVKEEINRVYEEILGLIPRLDVK